MRRGFEARDSVDKSLMRAARVHGAREKEAAMRSMRMTLATLIAVAGIAAMSQPPSVTRNVTSLGPAPRLGGKNGKTKAQWKQERRGRK